MWTLVRPHWPCLVIAHLQPSLRFTRGRQAVMQKQRMHACCAAMIYDICMLRPNMPCSAKFMTCSSPGTFIQSLKMVFLALQKPGFWVVLQVRRLQAARLPSRKTRQQVVCLRLRSRRCAQPFMQPAQQQAAKVTGMTEHILKASRMRCHRYDKQHYSPELGRNLPVQHCFLQPCHGKKRGAPILVIAMRCV